MYVDGASVATQTNEASAYTPTQVPSTSFEGVSPAAESIKYNCDPIARTTVVPITAARFWFGPQSPSKEALALRYAIASLSTPHTTDPEKDADNCMDGAIDKEVQFPDSYFIHPSTESLQK